MVGWQGDQPSDFNGFCHSLSRILELSNSSHPFVQFRWHTEWIMSVTPESHQNLRPALVIQTSHPQGELRISWRPLKMSGANRPISRDNATDTRYPGQGKTTQTGQTMWAAPWSWILRSNRIYIQDPLSSSSGIVYVTITSVAPVRCIGSGVWTYLFFCSPIVPPSSRGGQVVKGCKSGVASKYAQNKNNCGPSILEIPLKFRMTPQTGGGGFDKTKTDPTLGCATIGFITTPHRFVSS